MAKQKDAQEEAKEGGRKFRLPSAKGKCSTGIWFDRDDGKRPSIRIDLVDGVFTLSKEHWAGGREHMFIQTLLKNGFEEV